MTTVERRRIQFDYGPRSRPSVVRAIPPAAPSPPTFSTRASPSREPQLPPTLLPPAPTFTMASTESSQWLFTDAEILSTPSILDGLDPLEERTCRAKAAHFISQVGILLKLPQLTLAVAAVFFNRFYMRKSMVAAKKQPNEKNDHIHHYEIAATALFLATKTEEVCRKTKDVVIAVAKVAQKNTSLIIDEQSKEYWTWRDRILMYEELMLEELTFDLVLTSPYDILFKYLRDLRITDNKQIRNLSWAFLNDSCMTMLCLMMPAKDIAVAAIFFASSFSGETIPDDETGSPWWEQIGGDPSSITKATNVLTEFWSDNPLKKAEMPYAGYSSGDDLDRTRRQGSAMSSSMGGSPVSANGVAEVEKATPKRKPEDDEEEEGAVKEPSPKRARTEDAVPEDAES